MDHKLTSKGTRRRKRGLRKGNRAASKVDCGGKCEGPDVEPRRQRAKEKRSRGGRRRARRRRRRRRASQRPRQHSLDPSISLPGQGKTGSADLDTARWLRQSWLSTRWKLPLVAPDPALSRKSFTEPASAFSVPALLSVLLFQAPGSPQLRFLPGWPRNDERLRH